MSVDITEKQHYVWRKYLSAWQDDPTDYRLWTGLIKQNQVKRLGLKDVAQSRFFYKLEELTDAELLFLSQYKSRLSSNIQSIANPIISGYRWFTNIKRTIAKGIITPGEDFLHEIKKMEANVFEDIQSQIEHMGDDLLKCKSSGDLKTLAVEQEYEILFYLMVQYMRTKTRKDSFSNTLLDAPVLKAVADKCWPFFNIVTAMQWVEGMIIKKDYRFVYVHNKSAVPFITGDQPAINARWKETDEIGNIVALEIYYPISPTSALVLEFTPGKVFCDTYVDEVFVRERNGLIREEAGLYVFANEKEVIREVLGLIGD